MIGDLIADEFIYGRVERVSREAPVLILRYDSTVVVPGGAGNAANNVAALGARVRLAGLAGRDEPGRRMLDALHERVARTQVIGPAAYCTPVEDADPGRRRALRQAAGGAHRPRSRTGRPTARCAARSRRERSPSAPAQTRCSYQTTVPGS